MDSFEISKIAGGVLCALLVIVGFNTALHIAGGHHTEKPGYTLPMPAAPESKVSGAAVDAPVAMPASTAEFNPAEVAERIRNRQRAEWRSNVQEVPSLPYRRERRRQQGRTQSCGHRRPSQGEPRRL